MGTDEAQFIEAARTGDTGGFALLTEQFRRELHVHCYRMLASYDDAQDLTQETFLKAWSRRETFEGRSSLRTWLYRIATNCCLDLLEKRRDRTPVPTGTPGETEVLYLQPFPDRQLDEVRDPSETVIARETIELAFIVAVQHLPARQRAVLILRDVLGWSAKKTADSLELTLASANSALQRARETMREQLPDGRLDWSARSRRELSGDERAMVDKYVDLHRNFDIDRLASLLRADVKWAMPPEPGVYVGRQLCIDTWVNGGLGEPDCRDFATLPIVVNGQPAVALYLRKPGESAYTGFAVDVLEVVDGLVATIIAFGSDRFESLGLPMSLER